MKCAAADCLTEVDEDPGLCRRCGGLLLTEERWGMVMATRSPFWPAEPALWALEWDLAV